MSRVFSSWIAAFVVTFAIASGSHAENTVRLFKTPLPDPGAFPDGAPVRTYFISTTAFEDDLVEFRRQLIEHGARHVNMFLPDVVVCELPDDPEIERIINRPDVTRRDERDIALVASPAQGSRENWVKYCYDRAEQLAAAPPQSLDNQFEDRVLVIPPEEVREIERRSAAAGGTFQDRNIQQNAEFMMGDIYVRLIFPESNGSFEPDTEQWTETQLLEAQSAAITGMLAFQESFRDVPMHYLFQVFEQVPTGYEPITHNMDSDDLWVVDAMQSLGYGYGETEGRPVVHEFNNAGRRAKGTQWVYTAFVANSANDPDGRFAGGTYTAYATLGGPYLVIPYPAGKRGPDVDNYLVFSQVFQHESGHIFWALDEYPSAPGDCTNRSGYLNYSNENRQFYVGGLVVSCTADLQACMMNDAFTDRGRPWCRLTKGQVGVIDDNGNSIPDLYEGSPVVIWENADVETTLVPNITVRFKARTEAVPNQNPMQDPEKRADYATPLKDGKFSIDGGGELGLVPVDGKWDEMEEEFVITLASIPVGSTDIFVRVRNLVGFESTPYRKTVHFTGVRFTHMRLGVSGDRISLSWEVVGETFGATFNVRRLGPGQELPGTVVKSDVQPAGESNNGFLPFRYVDIDVEPGETYRYYIEGNFSIPVGNEIRDFRSTSDIIEQTAMIPITDSNIVSYASPNPFHNNTQFSVRVRYATDAYGRFVPVPQGGIPVNVNVYDVKGRLVKNLLARYELAEVVTLQWDGTDNLGRQVPTGVYFINAAAGEIRSARKILLVR